MKNAQRKRTLNRQEGTATLLLSFSTVRVLNAAALGSANNLSLRDTLRSQGCSLSAPTLNRILLRMTRNGWLASRKRSNGRLDYSLSSQGRAALDSARTHLQHLVPLLHAQRSLRPAPPTAKS